MPESDVSLENIRKSFALYLSDEGLDILCHNVHAYMNELEEKEMKPGDQMDMANLLKTVFPDIFIGVEVENIKRQLKDDELKGSD